MDSTQRLIDLATRLALTSGITVAVSSEPALDDPDYDSFWLLSSTEGSQTRIVVLKDLPRIVQDVAVAEQLQEFVIEERATHGLTAAWPDCPEHPATHPLNAVEAGDHAVWVCPKSGASHGLIESV